LDAEEEENAFIALSYDAIIPQNTHVEIANVHDPWNLCINNSLSRAQPVTAKLIPICNG